MGKLLSQVSPEEVERIAKTEAARYFQTHRVLNHIRDDVLSDAMLGAVVASQRYQSEQGATFATYAVHRVRGAIVDGMRTRGGRVGGATYEARTRHGDVLSLDAPSHDDSGETVADQLPATSFESDAVARIDVITAIRRLSEREQKVLHAYYFADRMLHEIADDMGVSEARVSQIRARAEARLRHLLAAT